MASEEYQPKLLHFADYNDPVLHNKTEPVSFPLSEEDQHLIADMIYSIQPAQLLAANAPWEAAVGMAANQWGIAKSIFLYCPTGDTVNGLEVVINPSYEAIAPTIAIVDPHVCDWEGCFSVPLSTGYIKRDRKIKIKFQDMTGKIIERQLAGFQARVWQHEADHTYGHLYDDPRTGKCVEKRVFPTLAEVEEFYAEVRERRKRE